MDYKIIITLILLVPLITIISVAIGAFLSSWRATDRLSKPIKRGISAVATLLILICVMFLAKWSGFNFVSSQSGLTINQSDSPVDISNS